MANNAVVKVAPGALVRLFVAGAIDIASNATVNAPPATGALLYVVSSAGEGSVLRLANNTASAWSLYAPLADVELLNNADLYGSVMAADAVVRNNGRLLIDESAMQPVPPTECQ